jgi:tellurite resistance protein
MNINTEAIRRVRDELLRREFSVGAVPEKARSGSSATLDPRQRAAMLRRVEPFAETMYLVMMADSESASVERRAVVAALDLLTGGMVDAKDLQAMLERFDDNAQREGSEGRLMRLGSVLAGDRDDRETAFTLAAVVALADERVELSENRVLDWVREYFGVSRRRAADLLESID